MSRWLKSALRMRSHTATADRPLSSHSGFQAGQPASASPPSPNVGAVRSGIMDQADPFQWAAAMWRALIASSTVSPGSWPSVRSVCGHTATASAVSMKATCGLWAPFPAGMLTGWLQAWPS